MEVGGQMAVEVWVRPPARACPGAGSHRPGVPEGHAHEAVWQRQVRRWRSGLRSVDRSARTQRRAQGARRLGGLLGDPWLQADPEEEAAGVPGLAGGPRGARAWSRPERVDLQLEDAGRPCLGRKGVQGEGTAGTQTSHPPRAPSPRPPGRTPSHPPFPLGLRPGEGKRAPGSPSGRGGGSSAGRPWPSGGLGSCSCWLRSLISERTAPPLRAAAGSRGP